MEKMYLSLPEITQAELNWAIKNALVQMKTVLSNFGNQLLSPCSEKQFYHPVQNVGWTTGFWPGELWLAYENTGEAVFREAALYHVQSFLERMEKRIAINTHDMGFLYTLSCVSAYHLTGDRRAQKAALLAGEHLKTRFHEKGQFLQAWGNVGERDNYRMIIDCLMNLPLLYWAARQTGDETYWKIAKAHTETAFAHIIREDGSTYHTYFFDPETGEPRYGATSQGYSQSSAWARGQAWGVYGIALAYAADPQPQYIPLFEKVTDFFIEHLPENGIPYWDFHFTTGSAEPWDSSASAVAVCGMLEMSKYLPQEKADYYVHTAKQLLGALVKECAASDPGISNGLLQHSTYCRKSPYNEHPDRSVDECSSWGDYFYLEALIRLSEPWVPYWTV